MAAILTPRQKIALKLLSGTKIAKVFYFTGGTALSFYYLNHRKSEDLDFFNENEFDPTGITFTLKSLQKHLHYSSFDYQNSFNRNIYLLSFHDKTKLKLEFTFYPFHQIERPRQIDGLFIDSPIDIAVNKLFTISQNPRGRDYFDLYFLSRKYQYNFDKLRMLAKQKFDWHIDALQLASRFYEVSEHLDDPILTKRTNFKTINTFFENEALNLKKHIVK